MVAVDQRQPVVSVCIPAFNRPEGLKRLLDSIDASTSSIEVLVAEDASPRRDEIVAVFCEWQRNNPDYRSFLILNHENLGFDANLRNLVQRANGTYVLFMGDDDSFIEGKLATWIQFLEENTTTGFVLREYQTVTDAGDVEAFGWSHIPLSFPNGTESICFLFKRCVVLCGFTVRTDLARSASTEVLDGTLLYQVWLMANAVKQAGAQYPKIRFVQATQSYRSGRAAFGSSERESSSFVPGAISPANSLAFVKAYLKVTGHIDSELTTDISDCVWMDLSRYSYPFLSIQRRNGIQAFMKYVWSLRQETPIAKSNYFWVYLIGLVCLGESGCDNLIRKLKKGRGVAPTLPG